MATVQGDEFWAVVAALVRNHRCRIRFQLAVDETWESEWDSWLIQPVPGYVETGQMGPVPVRSVVWCELRPDSADGSSALVTSLRAANLRWEWAGDNVRLPNYFRGSDKISQPK